jgi:hypothetical protein
VGVLAPLVLPLAHVIRGDVRALVLSFGLQALAAMLEQERTELCGPRYQHDGERRATRAGSAPGELVLARARSAAVSSKRRASAFAPGVYEARSWEERIITAPVSNEEPKWPRFFTVCSRQRSCAASSQSGISSRHCGALVAANRNTSPGQACGGSRRCATVRGRTALGLRWLKRPGRRRFKQGRGSTRRAGPSAVRPDGVRAAAGSDRRDERSATP